MMKKKGCLWSRPGELYQPWCSVGLRCHKTDHIHFWNLFQALGNRSGQGTRHYLHFFSKEREIVPCLLFHIVDFAKAIFFNLLRKYRNTVMTYSWVILFSLPNFFFKRKVSTQSTLLLTLLEMKASYIVYIICYQIF